MREIYAAEASLGVSDTMSSYVPLNQPVHSRKLLRLSRDLAML